MEEISDFGRQGLVSANFLGAKTINFFLDTFFNHTVFGRYDNDRLNSNDS